MKRITVHVPRNPELRNKQFEVAEDAMTLAEFMRQYLGKTDAELERIFVKEDGPVDFIVFINGVICRDWNYLLADGDKLLLNVMLGGG